MSIFSVGGAIQIILLISKIIGLIDWNWFVVFIPLEIVLALNILEAILEAIFKE